MDFDNDFYKQWKMKVTKNHRLFTDTLDFSKEGIQSGQIFSSTTIENQAETQSESFSLRLSQSYISETQESYDNTKLQKDKKQKEIILISDSSSDESIFSADKPQNINTKNIKNQLQKDCYNKESSVTPIQFKKEVKKKDMATSNRRVLDAESRKKTVIEESDSETEQSKVTLSEKKKKEIIQWLTTYIDDSRCGSSCSQESAISNSRKSGISSGNSSLERLEMNFETPNNRGKLLKSNNIQKSHKKVQTDFDKQRTLDQYFTQKKERQLSIVRTIMSESKHNSNHIIPESESFDSKTPQSKDTQTSSIDYVNRNFKRTLIPESTSIETIDDTNSSKNTPKVNSKFQQNKQIGQMQDDSLTNTTINDCADILENLYGTTWRNKASALICNTEPKKQTTKKFFKEVQTEKRITFRKPQFDFQSDDEISDKENDNNKSQKQNQATLKKLKNINTPKDNFINDDSTTESSPDCSYYTALTNPTPSQRNRFKSGYLNTVKTNSENIKNKLLSVCDSESDIDHGNWKSRDDNRRKLSFNSSSSSSTSEFDPEDIVPPKITTKGIKFKKTVNSKPLLTKKITQETQEIEKKSFLASLNKNVPLENVDFKAMVYRLKYNAKKEELCQVLYKLFNEKVFDNQLPNDMVVEWSARLRGTAGKCFNKQSLKALGKTVRSSRIVLATKILDSADRLRDTLIHEMCHAATWLINNVSDGHGPFWKAWASKATKVFPELPPISRCHNYEIQTKYTYKCTKCSYSIGRHSKSLDLNTKRCGYCHGTFELLINKVTKNGKIQKKPSETKEPSGFALYVKENYHLVKQTSTTVRHGEIMKILGQQFSAVKLTPKLQDRKTNDDDESP